MNGEHYDRYFHKWHTTIHGVETGQHDQGASDISAELQRSIKSSSNSPSYTAQGCPPVNDKYI